MQASIRLFFLPPPPFAAKQAIGLAQQLSQLVRLRFLTNPTAVALLSPWPAPAFVGPSRTYAAASRALGIAGPEGG